MLDDSGVKRKILEDMIFQKKEEIKNLEMNATELKSYLKGLEDIMRTLFTENLSHKNELICSSRKNGRSNFKKIKHHLSEGSRAYTTYQIFKSNNNKPLHITEICKILNIGDSKRRENFRDTLDQFCKKNKFFYKVRPACYALIEYEPIVLPLITTSEDVKILNSESFQGKSMTIN